MMRQKYFLSHALILSICYFTGVCMLASCGNPNKKKIDTDAIKIDYKTVQFHKELFSIDTNKMAEGVNALGNKYPDFSQIYFNNITGLNANGNPDLFIASVKHFLTYKDYRNLYDTVNIVFPNTAKIDKQLLELFKHVKYYFPDENWNTVYYFISGLNRYSAVTVDTLMCIGLDMFLGKDYPYYASVGLAQYESDHCEPPYIPVLASKAIFENRFEMHPEGKKLLDMMIYNGLEMTFLEYTLPEAPDELLMGYTKEQLEWCKENEKMVWSFFKKSDLLYSTEMQRMIRYVMDGPSSTGMPPESPGNIGSWVGWQIVRKYLKENPDVKWNELLAKKIDSQTFLASSKYKP